MTRKNNLPNEQDPLDWGVWPSGQRHLSLPLACNSTCIPSGHMHEYPLLGRPMHKNGQTLAELLELAEQALLPCRRLCEKIYNKNKSKTISDATLFISKDNFSELNTLRSMTLGRRLATVERPVPRFLSAIKMPWAFQSSQYITFLKTATANGWSVWSWKIKTKRVLEITWNARKH